MPNLLDSASNLRAALLRREFSARDLLGSTLAAIERLNPALNAIVQKDAASAWRAASESDSRIARGEARPLEGALWLDEPYAPVDATVAAALRKAALMLEEAGAIVDESARPAFSFEEAWEVFAVLTHALSGAGPPDKVRDKWAAREHDFLTSDLSHRALQARGMRLSTPVSSAFGLGGTPSPGVGTVFPTYRRRALPACLYGAHPARSTARSACAINRGQWQTKALFRPDSVGLSRIWRRFAGRRRSGDAWSGWIAARPPFRRGELRGRAAIACAAMLEALGASFRAPPMATP